MKKYRDDQLDSNPDYIDSAKHDNSLKKLLALNPDGVPDKTISKVLRLKQDEIDKIYNCAMIKLREALGENEEI
jgi:hypothetical protein